MSRPKPLNTPPSPSRSVTLWTEQGGSKDGAEGLFRFCRTPLSRSVWGWQSCRSNDLMTRDRAGDTRKPTRFSRGGIRTLALSQRHGGSLGHRGHPGQHSRRRVTHTRAAEVCSLPLTSLRSAPPLPGCPSHRRPLPVASARADFSGLPQDRWIKLTLSKPVSRQSLPGSAIWVLKMPSCTS